ncbi:amidohydrolase [Acinetobacter larvae]|uniref:Amidohydrolase n=1 Tax=Acinetobacter larvae TaxID=1789224 RepID=A0A1B2M169_9GAMM|nr:amidohydrolase [Acinetobacter larvae]AOA58763.1 amidohydrolase [Acinetobacter larvae]
MNSQFLQKFIEIRHHLHQYPELGEQTENTATLIADTLDDLGYQVHRYVGGQGVVAVMQRGQSPKRLGIRADMDALPIEEQNNLPYSSRHKGRMHACGHDGHTAILLAAAEWIAAQEDWEGTLNLIFQPAEETLTGAKKMLEDGLFERFPCDAVFALHNMPGIALGTVVVQEGAVMAASQHVVCRIRGVGGHGAMPELTQDPIMALSALIDALQTIKSRNLAVDDDAAISIGSIHCGTVYNIIPHDIELQISIRTNQEAVLQKINTRLQQIIAGIEISYAVKISMTQNNLVPATVNSAAESQFLAEHLQQGAGVDVKRQYKKLMGSEDFAWMLQELPGCYFFLGNGEGEHHGCSIHNARYDFNDDNILIGAQCWKTLVSAYLAPV